MTHILLLVAALGLTILVFGKKHLLEKDGRDKEVLYYFLKSSLEFLVPFTLVLLFYLGLLIVISMKWESISLHSLIRLEEYLTTIHSYTKWKLSKGMVLGLFVAIFVLGLLRVPLEARKKLYSGVDWIYTWSKRAYVLFVLLCSFTLLGTQLGQPTDDLRLRIKLIRDGYAELRQEAEEALSEEVAVQFHTKTRDNLSPEYQTALKRPEEIGSKTSNLRSHYAAAQREYGVKSGKAETVLSRFDSLNRSGLQTEIRLTEPTGKAPKATVSESEPGQITFQKVNEAKGALENYRQKTRGRFITFLSTEDGKKLTIQGAKVVTDVLKSELVSAWIKRYPIAEPFIDVFFKTLDEKIKARLETFAENATKEIIESPTRAEAAINTEASKIVNETEVKLSPEMVVRVEYLSAEFVVEITSIEAAKVEVDDGIQQFKDRKIEKLISQLQSPDESMRETAVRELSATSDISPAKIDKLISLMRNGRQSFLTDRTRIEGHHCTDYEYTSVKYYAASTLARINSPHVSSEIKQEARSCQASSITTRRVTDPGWI
jgi:hypothetical protein